MAIQKNIKLTDNFGIEVEIPNAYIKVESTNCSKQNSSYFVAIKKSNDGEVINKLMKDFNYDLSGENAIKQAYLHLKTLPEFADSVDC